MTTSEGPVSLRLRHHVYSSLQGYRTLFCSADVSEQTRRLLDELAKKCQRVCVDCEVSGYFGIGGGQVCFLRGRPHGTDHVGRARVCIHTVLLAESDLAKIPTFTPFSFPPEVFVDADADLQYVANQLSPVWNWERTPQNALTRRVEQLPEEQVVRILLPLLWREGAVDCLVGGSVAGPALEAVSNFLPPSRRRKMNYLRAAYLPEGGLPVPCRFFLLENAPAGIEEDPESTLVDFSNWVTNHLPPVGRVARHFLEQLYDMERAEDVIKLCALAERFGSAVEFDEYHMLQFADGCRHIRAAIQEDGTVSGDITPGDAAPAAVSFLRAGCLDLSVDMLQRAVTVLVDSDPLLPETVAGLRHLSPDSETVERIVTEVAEKIEQIRSPDSRGDTSFFGIS